MQLNELLSRVEVIGIPTRTNFRGVRIREIALIKGERRWGEFSPFADYSTERDALWLQAALEAANQNFPKPLRNRVLVNATLPEVAVERIGEVLSWFPGSSTVKVKVGTANDEERIAEVFKIIPDARLRLDANGLFSIHQAQEFLLSLYNKYGHQIEYVEQPCASLAENGALSLPFPIAIDENLLDKPVVISSALESSAGLSAGVALAAHLAEDVICGLGTAALLDGDITKNSLLPLNGAVTVEEIDVDLESVARYRLPQERIDWWHNRITNAYKSIESENEREELI